MLSKQLQSIKKSRKISEFGLKRKIQFLDTRDIDEETLLELLPFQTAFTGEKSLEFQRDMLTAVQENKFKPKIASFLRSCLKHMEETNVEYFLEYMCRKYLVHTFNADDLAFLLLPFRKFYGIFLCIESDIVRYFQFNDRFSYVFLGDFFVREERFRDFVMDYFEHYEVSGVNEFLKNIAAEVFRKQSEYKGRAY